MLFNRARAIDYMREYGLDVLVATSPVNITYFTDYFCWIDPLFKEFMMVPGASSNLAQAYAVFPLEGEPALVVNPLFAVNAEELWVKDLHIFGSAGLNITYFTDYFCWIDPLFKEFMMVPGASSNLAQAYAVFPLEGEPALVVNPLFAVNAEELWVKDLHIFGSAGLDDSLPAGELPQSLRRFHELLHASHGNATATDALLSILKQRGLTGARIGLEMERLPPETNDLIRRALPGASLRNCADLIRLIRMVKSAEEIQRLTRSAEINEQAAMESLAMARPGRPVSKLAEHYRAQAARLGADLDHFAFGVRGLGMTTETNYQLAEDDVLYVDFGCIYQYCFSDSGTTLAMRELSPELSERHAALRACMDAGGEALRPGAKASAAAGAMVQALHDRGITASFPHGHGVGLEVRDYPIVVPDNGLRIKDDCVDLPSDLTLEVDMVLNLEAPLFMPGVGSLHIEQSYVVTPQGNRPLVAQQRQRPVVSGH